MRKKIVAGNWKMNLDLVEATALTESLKQSNFPKDVEIMVFPTFIYLDRIQQELKGQIKVGAQNFYSETKGAFTGEVSFSQLKSIDVSHVLVGHSERRSIFNESHEDLKRKVDAALSNQLEVIFCCGEPLEIRESNNQEAYVKQQLIESLFHLNDEQLKKCVIAYEPVWAIGTGKTASTEQAEEMHLAIRNWISEQYGVEIANSISILYGGSCNAANAKELFSCPNVDGGLIGGAALTADTFSSIANSF